MRPGVVDLLDRARARIRLRIGSSLPIEERVRGFWAGAVVARKYGASDVVHAELRDLADKVALTHDLPGGAETVEHLIKSAFFDHNPFGKK
jgi:hypothetical protein